MANEDLKLEDLSREQILDLADASGRKLGFLLAVSAFDDEVKNAIVNILEQATPAQLDTLIRIFEEGYLRAQNKDLDDFLKNELVAIKKEADAQRQSLDTAMLSELEDFSKRLHGVD